MEQLLSPRQVALAMGVSESSLKRWCDQGLLQTRRTAGGHRRLPLDTVMQFLRNNDQSLLRPEVLGLPSTTGKGMLVIDRAIGQMCEALEQGDEELARRTVFDLYLSRQSAVDICDKVIAAAFHSIGNHWECGDIEVYQERRGCEICLKTLFALRSVIGQPREDASRAIGGTLSGDQYHLPTTMVEIALRENGWRADSLGTGMPVETICSAMQNEQPEMLWLSISFVEDAKRFLRDYRKIAAVAADKNVPVAVGGRALAAELRQQMTYAAYCDTLRHLVTFAATIARKERQNKPNERDKK